MDRHSRFMLTIVGEDRPGIVAGVARSLFEGGCNLGEASMIRLGGCFTVMLVVKHPSASVPAVEQMLRKVVDELALTVNIKQLPALSSAAERAVPDARIRVFGADRPGIVARATAALAAAGLNILHLESDVGGSEERPIYVMTIEGQARSGFEALQQALQGIADSGVEAALEPVETMFG